MRKALILLFVLQGFTAFSQLIDPFTIRYSTQQKGGIRFLANVAVSCDQSGLSCANAANDLPVTGSNPQDNNDFTQQYVDVDGVATTFMSTSDSLDLPTCSEVLWAGLYWGARVSTSTSGYAIREKIKLSVDNGAYQNLVADELIDFTGTFSYFCFKDITSIVQSNAINARYTVADQIAQTGSSNRWGGWSIVIVYKNVLESMRNLTVFDGLANVSQFGSGTNVSQVDIPVSGFLTPISGPVSFELGVIAYDGDRQQTGDELEFNGVGSYVNISDAIHNQTNVFNSTISYDGTLTPHRLPSLNNTFGHDANIFLPNNSGFNYLPNNATSGTIRVSTGGETILTQVITSAIDVYEPDLRATVYLDDINGGQVVPGDTLEYTIVGKNIGSDPSVNTFMTDTLDIRTEFVPNSISVVSGPNTGAKTDAYLDDQGEYDSTNRVVVVRVGTGANASTGGTMQNSPTGADSTQIRYRVTVIDDCLLITCDSILDDQAYIFGEGDISGNTYNNGGLSDYTDANGCPIGSPTQLIIRTTGCPNAEIITNAPICVGDSLLMYCPPMTTSIADSLAIYSWTGPNGFTDTLSDVFIHPATLADSGIYNLELSFAGLSCILSYATDTVVVNPNPIISLIDSANVSCFGANDGWINVSSSSIVPSNLTWSNGSTQDSIFNLGPDTYTVSVIDTNSCSTDSTYSITEPDSLHIVPSITSDYNGQDISCFNASDGSVVVSTTGGTTPYTFLWSNGSTDSTANGLGEGTYVITVTDANGCVKVDSITLIQPTQLIIEDSISPVLCFGDSIGAIDITVSGATPGYAYSWSNGSVNQDLSGLITGNYTITVTDTNNCQEVSTLNVTQPSAPLSLSENHIDVNCFGDSTGSINLNPVGGTPSYTYNWSGPVNGTSQDLINLPTGAYLVLVADSNGCTDSLLTTIDQPLAPLSLSTITIDNPCHNDSIGSIDLTVSGGTVNYSYSWSNGSITQDLFNLPEGTYSVVVTDSNGCIESSTVAINHPFAPLSLSDTSFAVNCFGGNDGAVDLSVSGGTSPYTYLWSNGEISQDIDSLIAGTYTVVVTDSNNCQDSLQVIVSEPIAPLAIDLFTSSPVLCFGDSTGSIDLSVSGGTAPYDYNWSNGDTTQNIDSIPTGLYSFVVTDTNGCTLIDSIDVLQPSAPLSLVSTVVDVLCFGGNNASISTVVSGGTTPYTYQWSNSEITDSIGGLIQGNYSIQVLDSNLCSLDSSFVINQPSAPLLLSATSEEVLCFGGNDGSIDLTVTGGTVSYSYLWNTLDTTQDLTSLSVGTYTVVVTDSNSCVDSLSVNVNQPSNPLTLSETHQNVLCYGGNDGSIDLSVTGGTSPYVYSWSTGAVTEDISGLSVGSYAVTVTDSNNCSVTLSINISQPLAPLSLGTIIQGVSCFGGSNGEIDLVVSGGTTPYSFIWSNGSTNEDLTNVSTGIYDVNVTDSNGCAISGTYSVGQPLAELSLTESHVNVLCFGDSTGSININSLGGTAPYTYLWDTGATTEDITNLIAGTYTVIATDSLGCDTSLTIIVTEPFAPLFLSSLVTDVLCFGESTGAIDLSVTGGTPSYSYSWVNGANTQDIDSVTIGNYTVVVTDAAGCVDSLTSSITQPSSPLLITETHTDALCVATQTGSIDASVSGGSPGYSYSWSNGQATEDISLLSAGTYYLTVTDAHSCEDTISVTILDPSNTITASAVKSDVLCYGGFDGQIDITVSGGNPGYNYNWSNGSITEDLTNLSEGTYFVNITDVLGCDFFLSVDILEPLSPLTVDTLITDVVCFNQTTGAITLSVSGGTVPYTYLWSTGDTTASIFNLSAGNYSVIVTDSNGCVQNLSLSVDQPLAPLTVTEVHQNVSCFAGNDGFIDLTVSGGVPGYNYTWNTGQITQDLSSIIAGNYSVTVQDSNGCTNVLPISIVQPSSVVNATQVVTNVSCIGGSDGYIDVSVSGGTPNYSFLWNTGAITEDLANVPEGVYSVVITDTNGCTFALSAQVTQPMSAVSLSVSKTDVLCHGGATGTATVVANGGTAPYTYLWTNGDNTNIADSLVAGNYTVVVTDSKGCIDSISVAITQPSALVAITSSTHNSCYGQTSGSVSVVVSGGVTPYSYLWNTGATTTSINNLAAGPYFVTITDGLLCTVTFSDTVNQPLAPLNIQSVVVDNICFGEANGSIDNTITGGTPPYQFQWNNTATSEDLSNLLAGTYDLTVQDSNGCIELSSITVGQPGSGISATTSVVPVLCNGDSTGSINLTVSGPNAPFSYSWDNGDTTQNIDSLPAGIYIVTISNTNGCITSVSDTVNEPISSMSLAISVTDVSCNFGDDGAVDLSVIGGSPPYTYLWSNGDGSQDIDSLQAGNYTVIVTDDFGCQDSITATVNEPINPLSASLIITNVGCFGQNSGEIDLTVTGGTPNYTYLWNNNSVSEDLSGVGSGFYSVTVTDAKGCTTFISDMVNQPVSNVQISALISDVTCNGFNDGSIDLSVSGGTSPYTFLWNHGPVTEDVDSLPAGAYQVLITDSNLCTSVWDFTIDEPNQPLMLSLISSPVTCYNGSDGDIDLTVSGGSPSYLYTWSNGFSSEDVNNVTAGIYSVVVTDLYGCSIEDSIEISQPSIYSLTLNGNNIGCFGDSSGNIDLIVTGGANPLSYSWTNGSSTEDISNLLAGQYIVTVIDSVGCILTDSITLSQPTFPNSLSAVVTDVDCFNASTGTIDLTVTSFNTGYNFQWDNGLSSEDLTNLPAGTYTVIVTDDEFCSDTLSINVNQSSQIQTSNLVTSVSCFNLSDGSIDLTVNGGTAPYTYNWSNGDTLQDIDTLVSGTYFVTITDSLGCDVTASIDVTQPSSPLIVIDSVVDVTCNGLNNGQIYIAVSGGSLPYSFAWSNAATSQDLLNVTAGFYQVDITDGEGCVETTDMFVEEPDSALSISFLNSNVNCFGANDGSIDLTVDGGTPGYSYSWSTGDTLQDIDSLVIGTYYVTVIDSLGCTIDDSTIITQPPTSLSIFLTATHVSCLGFSDGSIDMTITGGVGPYVVNWNSGQTTEDISLLPAGTYDVSVQDSNGCIVTGSIVVVEPLSPLSLSGTFVDVLCFGDSTGAIDVSLSGGTFPYTYSWSNGGTTQDLNNIPAGSYSLDVTDFNGCMANISFPISQPSSAITITFNTQDILCYGDSTGLINIDVTGGAPGYTYLWSTGDTLQDIDSLFAGIYTISVTDSIGCIVDTNISIIQPANPITVSAVISNVNCFAGSDGSIDLSLSGGTPPYSYIWDNGQISQDISSLIAGTYTVSIIDSNSCSFDSTFTVTQPLAPLFISETHTDIVCYGDSTGSVDISVSGGTSPYSYLWSSGQTSEDLVDVPAGTYQVLVTDFNGCIDSIVVVLTQPLEPITILETHQNINCFGNNNGSIDITVSGGTGSYTYAWSNLEFTQDISNLVAGTYTVVVTDSVGCVDSLDITLTQPSSPLFISVLVTTPPCNGQPGGAIDVTVTGGTGPYTYFWTPTLDTTEDLSGIGAGVYQLSVTDDNSCVGFTVVNVTEPAQPLVVTYTETPVSCYGLSDGTILLDIQGGSVPYSILWDNGETGLFIDSLSAGIYNVVVTDTNGCVVNTAAIVTQPEEIATDFFFDVSTGCVPLTVNFTNNSQGNPLSCVWDFGNGDTLVGCGSVSYTFNVEGCYDVSLTTLANTGCYGTMTMDSAICVMPNPIASFTSTTANIDYYTGQIIFMNNSIGAQEYIWFFGDGSPNSNAVNPAHNYPQELESTYDVTLIAIDTVYGCIDTAILTFELLDELAFYVPNTFTITEDDINEEFFPVFSSPASIESFDFKVYDRWGELVYTSGNINDKWDGTHGNRNRPAQEGTYSWKLTFTTNKGIERAVAGHVNLLR